MSQIRSIVVARVPMMNLIRRDRLTKLSRPIGDICILVVRIFKYRGVQSGVRTPFFGWNMPERVGGLCGSRIGGGERPERPERVSRCKSYDSTFDWSVFATQVTGGFREQIKTVF